MVKAVSAKFQGDLSKTITWISAFSHPTVRESSRKLKSVELLQNWKKFVFLFSHEKVPCKWVNLLLNGNFTLFNLCSGGQKQYYWSFYIEKRKSNFNSRFTLNFWLLLFSSTKIQNVTEKKKYSHTWNICQIRPSCIQLLHFTVLEEANGTQRQ